MSTPAPTLWSWDSPMSRRAYVTTGIILSAFKYPLDLGVSHAFGRPWTPLRYFTLRMLATDETPQYLFALLAVAIPFIVVGVVLSARRLRDMGVHPFWAGLFLFPMVHWLFILVLALCPSASTDDRAREDGPYRSPERPEPKLPPLPLRIIPRSEVGAFLFGLLLTVGVGLGCFVVAVEFGRTLGAGLFVGVPVGMGFIMGFCVTYGRGRVPPRIATYGFAPTVMMLVALFVLSREGLACILMASPIVFAMCAFGAWFGAWCASAGVVPPDVGAALALLLGPASVAIDQAAAPAAEPLTIESSVIVQAKPDAVWRGLIAMPRIEAAPKPIFAIVAMPVEVRADGSDPGAPRRFVFTNGEFVAPVVAWDEGRELKLRVDRQPTQLDHILTVTGGGVSLSANPDGTTLMRATTAYELRIRPVAYWGRWTNALLGAVHARLLEQVKRTAEHPDSALDAPSPGMPAWMEASNATCPCTRHADRTNGEAQN